MKKIVQFIDEKLLRYGVAFAIIFTALYPKLPSVHINHTWVYIRLEDFVILLLSFIWFIQLLRKKVSLPKPEGYALILYWIAGFVSLLYCFAFLASHLVNFFPTVAGLEDARRIEYMILFFVAFSTVRSVKDVYFYLITLYITIAGIVIYGFGQRFYLNLWKIFPTFFQQNPFCFPAFLTGNEEFAKGVPLCLTETSRISSTFGGHYDLSAYLVFVIPTLVALFFAVKRISLRVLILILSVFAMQLLNFTSSRTSFAAYLLGVIAMFLFWNRKRLIIPVLIFSVAVMFFSSDATIKRFEETIQPVQVVSTESQLPPDLKQIIAKTKETEEIQSSEVPPASDFTVGNTQVAPVASKSVGFQTVLTPAQLAAIKLKGDAISTVSGSFLIQKAYALDVSFTTRFQAEWPRNWKAFLSSPLFGTGYSSLTLATDNDYLRAIGETGLAGLLTFVFIFVVLGIFMKNTVWNIKDDVTKAFVFGLSGGIVGLLINAVLIDVFEASKVAEPFWMLLGIGVGAAYLTKKSPINYKEELIKFFFSPAMIITYLLVIILTAYVGSINNFFVADDFTWLRWAATSDLKEITSYFVNSKDFFYRPLDKTVVFFLYQLFSFQPQGYHLFTIIVHFITTVGVFYLATKVFNKKLLGFFTAVLFALHPVHQENLYWFSTLSVTISTAFIVYALLAYIRFREKKSIISYIVSIILSVCAFLSYEMAVVLPVLLILFGLFFGKKKSFTKFIVVYLPFLCMIPLYFVIRFLTHAFTSGGDYSYNLLNLPFNFVGNYLGYSMLFIGGNNALPAYTFIRDTLKEQHLYALAILILIIIIIGVLVNTFRKKIHHFAKNQFIVIAVFGLFFAAVSLLPFLGLGNIAPRYFYLASIGFSMTAVALLHVLLMHLPLKKNYIKILFVLIIACISLWYYGEGLAYAQEWGAAGDITKGALKVFRLNYEGFSKTTDVYIAASPMKYKDAWLFPPQVGLSDALWFIYRDSQPHVIMKGSVPEAKQQMQQGTNHDSYIFTFDQYDNVVRVQ